MKQEIRGLGWMVLLVGTVVCVVAFRDDGDREQLTAGELIRLHLDSIAPPERLALRDAFAVQGDCEYRLISGGALTAQGTAQLVSQGEAYNVLFDFAAGEYAGTEFITDGERTDIEYRSGGQVNPLWIFLKGQDVLLKEGLLGGELTTAWALFNVQDRNPGLTYRGVEEVDGQPLHRLDYAPRKGGYGLTVRLYFEPENFHHVLSTYEVTESAPMGATPATSSNQRISRRRIEERFSDFEDHSGYTLPTTWTLLYFKSGNDAGAIGVSNRNLNIAPGLGYRRPGPALTEDPNSATILLQWKTVIKHSAQNEEIPPDMLEGLLKMD